MAKPAGDDTLKGYAQLDIILGGDGNDSVDGGVDGDHLYGQAGVDTLTYATRTNPVYVSLASNQGSGEILEGDLIDPSFEIAYGGSGGDIMEGGPSGVNNILFAMDGDDHITAGSVPLWGNGGNGDDELFGGPTEDILNGHAGDDVLTGGAGRDTNNGYAGADLIVAEGDGDGVSGGPDDDIVSYEALFVPMDVNLAAGSAWAVGADLSDSMPNLDVENVVTGNDNDVIDISGDGVNGEVVCNGGVDSVIRDLGDSVDASCENITIAP